MFITSLISRPPSPGGKLRLRQHRLGRLERLGEGAGEVGIGAVARLDRHDMPADGAAEKRQVADDIEDLVPNESRRETERLLAQDGLCP